MRYALHSAALLAFVLVVLEILSRFALGHNPTNRIDARYDSLPASNQPIVQSTEGFLRSRTNELGHLDRPMPHPLPSDGVMVIGDSLTEARQVPLDDRFSDRVGAALGRRVYNVGHTGWSPLNALAFLTAERDAFRPQTVIVQISGNDLDDIGSKRRIHLTERAGRFEIVLPDRTKRGVAATFNSIKNLVAVSAFGGNAVSSTMQIFGVEAGGESSCATPDPFAIRAMKWIIEQLQLVHPDVRLLYLPLLEYHGGCSDRCAPARATYSAIADATHTRFIDPTTAMCTRFEHTRQPLHGFWNTIPGTGHVNSDGHAVIADVLTTHLRER